jgi:hypothetical protein
LSPLLASWLPTLVLIPLIGFGLYRRTRGAFKRQRVNAGRTVPRMVVLTLFSGLFLFTLPTVPGFAAAAIGATLGIGIALLGLTHTRYEVSAEGKFYTPNVYIGLLVTALFLGRLAGRLVTVLQTSADAVAAPGAPLAGIQRSPVTMGIYFLMAAYYVCFSWGVLLKARGLKP